MKTLNHIPHKKNYRPQVDIVIFRRDLPRITYSKENAAYLVETIVATIESKSVIDKKQLENACKVAKTHKTLKRRPSSLIFGHEPPSILSVPPSTHGYVTKVLFEKFETL